MGHRASAPSEAPVKHRSLFASLLLASTALFLAPTAADASTPFCSGNLCFTVDLPGTVAAPGVQRIDLGTGGAAPAGSKLTPIQTYAATGKVVGYSGTVAAGPETLTFGTGNVAGALVYGTYSGNTASGIPKNLSVSAPRDAAGNAWTGNYEGLIQNNGAYLRNAFSAANGYFGALVSGIDANTTFTFDGASGATQLTGAAILNAARASGLGTAPGYYLNVSMAPGSGYTSVTVRSTSSSVSMADMAYSVDRVDLATATAGGAAPAPLPALAGTPFGLLAAAAFLRRRRRR